MAEQTAKSNDVLLRSKLLSTPPHPTAPPSPSEQSQHISCLKPKQSGECFARGSNKDFYTSICGAI